jgi:DUF971 family protein
MRINAPACHSLPVDIIYHQRSNYLEMCYDDGSVFNMTSEYLRVFTQSAEAVGHGVGQSILQIDKADVTILDIKAIGHYAIQLSFSDGHNSGIYSWDLLHYLGTHHDTLWASYQQQLADHSAHLH